MEHPLREVEAEALRLAQDIVSYDRQVDGSRRSSNNVKRLKRLQLGDLICESPNPEQLKQVIVENSALSFAEVEDIHGVTSFNRNSGRDKDLRQLELSFTQNRNLALIRVAVRDGETPPSAEERIDAVIACIERHDGVFKEDAQYRQAIGILPPPNSMANIKERAKHDPEYREELEAQGIYIIEEDDDDEDEDDDDEEQGRGRSRNQRLNPWIKTITSMSTKVAKLREKAFNRDDAPYMLIEKCQVWSEDLLGIAALIEGRLTMSDPQQEERV